MSSGGGWDISLGIQTCLDSFLPAEGSNGIWFNICFFVGDFSERISID